MAVIKTEQPEPKTTPSGAPNVRPFDVFSRMPTTSSWTGAASQYIEKIRNTLEDKSTTLSIEMKRIPTAPDALVFVSSAKNVIILLLDRGTVNSSTMMNVFDDSDLALYKNDNRFVEISRRFKEAFPKHNLINIVLVNKFMLDRPVQMANYIGKTILTYDLGTEKHLTIDSFRPSDAITINDHLPTVREFFNEFSTMPVAAADFGFIASVSDGAQSMSSPDRYSVSTPMFGVTGYVEFIKPPRNIIHPNMNSKVYVPVVHISDIISLHPAPQMMALALPLIADIFMNRNGGLWKKQFDIGGRIDINIGNLVNDDTTGKPFKVESRDHLDDLFSNFISPYPILVMDVRLGHASIPGLNLFTYDPPEIGNEMAKFINNELVKDAPISDNAFSEIVGVANDSNGNLIDTRSVTFLSRIPLMKREEIEALLERDIYEQENRFKLIRSLTSNCTPTHGAWIVTLRAEFIRAITSQVSGRLNVKFNQADTVPKFDPYSYMNQSYAPEIGFGHQMFPDPNSRGFRSW